VAIDFRDRKQTLTCQQLLGDVLFKAGQRDMGLTVVLRGEVQVVE